MVAGVVVLADWQSTTSAIAGIVSAVGVIFAIVAAYIAWRQWKNDQAREVRREVDWMSRG